MSEGITLSVLVFGIDSTVTDKVSARLQSQGVDARSLAISNTPESDAEIQRVAGEKNWSGLIVGHGVRQDQEWFERVMKIVNEVNSNISTVNTKGPDDVENAIERHFDVKLPLTRT